MASICTAHLPTMWYVDKYLIYTTYLIQLRRSRTPTMLPPSQTASTVLLQHLCCVRYDYILSD